MRHFAQAGGKLKIIIVKGPKGTVEIFTEDGQKLPRSACKKVMDQIASLTGAESVDHNGNPDYAAGNEKPLVNTDINVLDETLDGLKN